MLTDRWTRTNIGWVETVGTLTARAVTIGTIGPVLPCAAPGSSAGIGLARRLINPYFLELPYVHTL